MSVISTRLTAAAALCLVLATPALPQRAAAPSQEGVAAAKELMAVTGAEKNMDIMMANMIPQFASILKQQRPDQAAAIDEVFASLSTRMMARKQEMLDLIAPLYAERFSAEELKQVTAFFKSATGVKFVAAQPEILQRSMLIGQQWGQRIGAEIDAEVRRELKKKGIDL